ncbi:hypothetical protein K438DRAFT_491282 [Mycena galopus ATCC 62051]|nr:hypothetical protein K438DRAFT_491282 [Mycena galopus ATCC 62051]
MATAWRRQANQLDGRPHMFTPRYNPDGLRLPPGQPAPLWNQRTEHPDYVHQWAPTYPQPPVIPPDPWDIESPFVRPMSLMPMGPNRNPRWSWTPGYPQAPPGIPHGDGSPFGRPMDDSLVFPNWNPPSPWAPQPPPTGFRQLPYGDGSPFPTPMNVAPPLPPMLMVPFSPSPFPPMPMTPAMSSRDILPVVFAKRDPCDCECLAARPSDWRHDYTPPRRFRFPSPFRGGNPLPPYLPLASPNPRVFPEKLKINLEHSHLCPTLLMPTSKMPVISFDLRSDAPFDPSNLELLTIANRPFNPTDLFQFATTRPVSRLRFYHPRLPWYFDVYASLPNGILVADVLQQLHAMLHLPIRPHDFSNTVLNAADREVITSAYRSRCDIRVDLMQQGVRRVDFLGADVILQGFMEGKDGMWRMRTTSYTP